MLAYKLVENKKFNKVFREYYMTQGDTFQNSLNFTRNGIKITPELTQKLLFKLFNFDTHEIEYEQEYRYDEEQGKWLISIPSSETYNWEETAHLYEYEVTYFDGVVRTLAQAKFNITLQGKDKGV